MLCALLHTKELHNIILKGMIEEKNTVGHPWNSYIEQIKYDARVKPFYELKENVKNQTEWKIRVVNQSSDEK